MGRNRSKNELHPRPSEDASNYEKAAWNMSSAIILFMRENALSKNDIINRLSDVSSIQTISNWTASHESGAQRFPKHKNLMELYFWGLEPGMKPFRYWMIFTGNAEQGSEEIKELEKLREAMKEYGYSPSDFLSNAR